MAARKRNWTPEIVRQRIRTGLLTRYLFEHVSGSRKMTATQVNAALGLLRKTLPDLSATELSGEVKTRDITDEPLTAEQWEEQYADRPN